MQTHACLQRSLGIDLCVRTPSAGRGQRARVCQVSASCFADQLASKFKDPVARAIIKEPAVFSFGIVAGFLGLDIKEPPLSDWLERTATFMQEPEAITITVIEPQPGAYGDEIAKGAPRSRF